MRTLKNVQDTHGAQQEIFKTLNDFFTSEPIENIIEQLGTSFVTSISQKDCHGDLVYSEDRVIEEAFRHTQLINFLVKMNRLYSKVK